MNKKIINIGFVIVFSLVSTILASCGESSKTSNLITASGESNSPKPQISISASSINTFTPADGKPGDVITITGTNLTDATSVKFNGIDATNFTLEGKSIKATVPDGNTTGKISIITNSGTAISLFNFTKLPVWTIEPGTNEDDSASRVVVDSSGNSYLVGVTEGRFDGTIDYMKIDGFLSKYDTKGTQQWIKQIRTEKDDYVSSLSMDRSGNIYVTGSTEGGLDGNINLGSSDIILIKYDTNGNKQWTRQLGSKEWDAGNGVAVDSSGNIYVAGETYGNLDGNVNQGSGDIFLIKYDTNGNKQWTRQLGSTSLDNSSDVVVDSSGNIYATGKTDGNLDGNINQGKYDIFLVKYDTNGNKQWTRQLGTKEWDAANGIKLDSSGNIYVTGETAGNLDDNINQGYYDMFLIKYDTNGNKQWARQLGSKKSDIGNGIDVDNTGNIYITGSTDGDLDGNINLGDLDVFIVKYDTNGNKQWTQQFGSKERDSAYGVAVDNSVNLYVTGDTKGDLYGNINHRDDYNFLFYDIFLMKLRL